MPSEKEIFAYLEELRDSGATNMYGATPYLEDAFEMSKKDAREWLVKWMKSFD